jgi:hypothetical protein
MHGAGTTGSAGNTRPSLRDGLTAYSARSPGTGLFCPRHTRSAHCTFQEFSASVGAPGPHGLAVRESLTRERCEGGYHPIAIPAKADQLVRRRETRPRAVAATAPRLHVRDDRETSLFMRRDVREHRFDLPDEASAIACGMLARRAVCAWCPCADCPSCRRPDRRRQCVGCAKRSVRTIHAPSASAISFMSVTQSAHPPPPAEGVATRTSRALMPWWCARFALHTLRACT